MTLIHGALKGYSIHQVVFWASLPNWISKQNILNTLTLFNPALFGPYNTQGGEQICPQAFSFFPELLEGATFSKMGLQLSSRKNL